MYDTGNQATTFALAGVGAELGPALTQMMLASAIEPGSAPGYQLCKTIYSYHPLGAILASAPITLAQSQGRTIDVPVLGEKRIVEQFEKTWAKISKVGATVVLHNLMTLKRVYGIASLGVGEVGKQLTTPLDLSKIKAENLFFNVLDPLNTAGSLVLHQDPNSPDFLKPVGAITVAGQEWHPSRILPVMNEQPLFIDWSASAYGFVGRSVYQRALYPMKTFLQSMITDQMVTQKAGLLVAKMESPGSFIDNVMQSFAGWKRGQIKAGVTGQVLQIGVTEDVQTLNMMNLDKAAEFARNNVFKNIASAAGMPAGIVNNETLAEGFGEGTEDAKTIARYLDYVRTDMQPAYDFMDRIVMRAAWTPEFYETLKVNYKKLPPFKTWLHECMQAFSGSWPNLLVEPDSEKSKNEDVKMKSAIALAEVMLPEVDPESKAKILTWLADIVNDAETLFASKLDLDADAMVAYFDENRQNQQQAMQGGDTEPAEPKPFGLTA